MAHKWARWLHNPCCRGGSLALQSGGQNQKWSTLVRWLHKACRLWGSPQHQSGGQDHKWPTGGQGGYITPAAWGVPSALERGERSQVAHKWARWLHNPCLPGGPCRFKAVGGITGGAQVGKVAT